MQHPYQEDGLAELVIYCSTIFRHLKREVDRPINQRRTGELRTGSTISWLVAAWSVGTVGVSDEIGGFDAVAPSNEFDASIVVATQSTDDSLRPHAGSAVLEQLASSSGHANQPSSSCTQSCG